MNDLKVFENPEFGKIRTIEEDGKVLFCGSDVAKVLGYKNPSKALSDHCKGVTKRYAPTQSGTQEMNFISEGDVYRLIANSKLPSAERFEIWVFDEVLPSIRKNGSYMIGQSIFEPTPYLQLLAETEREKVRAQKAQILSHIAESYDGTYRQILQAYAAKELVGKFALPLPEMPEETFTAEQIGSRLGISANKVGRIANAYGLKTEEYGKWFVDKSPHSTKEVRTFRYFESVIPEMKKVIAKGA